MGYYIKVEPNVKVYVEDLNPNGDKIIVFLHGWPGNHNLFEYQFNHLPKLGYRCIGIDQRGFGKSDKPYGGYDHDRLSDDEIDQVRQYVVADSVVKNSEFKEIGDKRFIKMANQFVNIDDLHINLIDRVNPFQRAFEILSKSVTTHVLKLIKDTIDATRIQMTEEEAIILWPKINEFITKNNRQHNIESLDPLEKRMAEAIIFLKELKRKMSRNG